MSPLVYPLPGNEALATALAQHWPAEAGRLEVHRFPDEESLVRLLDAPRGRDVVLACTLRAPDAKLWPLLAAADTARELGARSVGLVAPYLAYMRQDRQFAAGQAVSARLFAHLLSGHFDWLATVDPHLHRVHSLDQVFSIPAATMAAAPLLARWIEAEFARPVLVGPDDESRQWVEEVARLAQAPSAVFDKQRHGDRDVKVRVTDLERWRGHTPVIVDDIISSGGTLADTVRQLCAQGMVAPVCVAVHAVFAPGAHEAVLAAGAARIVTTDTIPHATNGIGVAAALAQECRALLERMPRAGSEPVRVALG